MLELFFHASLLIKVVLVTLGALSVVCWTIILYKFVSLRAASQELRTLLASLQVGAPPAVLDALRATAAQLHLSPLADVVTKIAKRSAGSEEELRQMLHTCQAQGVEQLESYLVMLATTGSTAPFIGLLGTVWGIMDAFRGIGAAGSASLAVVAPAIAEALITTAAGLAAAIPAVMAYNFFVHQVRKLAVMLENCSAALQGFALTRSK